MTLGATRRFACAPSSEQVGAWQLLPRLLRPAGPRSAFRTRVLLWPDPFW